MFYKNSYLKKNPFLAVILSLSGLFSNKITAQESEEKEVFKPHHEIGISINHVHVFEGIDDNGNKEVLALPAWGIDYTYHISQKWAIGLHTDFIIEKFKVEKDLESGKEDETIERSYPIAPALMGIYKLNEHWSFLLGMGGEFAKEDDFLLTRAGAEYGYELPKGWEIFGTFSYDIKWNAYDSWGIGLGIAKSFGGK